MRYLVTGTFCAKQPPPGCQEWLFREVKFIHQIHSFERAATRGRIRTWRIFLFSSGQKQCPGIEPALNGAASPQKSFNYLELWQTVVSARRCASIKANKEAGRDWGSLLVSLSTPLQRVMSNTGLRSKENTQILKYWPIHAFSYLFPPSIHPPLHPFIDASFQTSWQLLHQESMLFDESAVHLNSVDVSLLSDWIGIWVDHQFGHLSL